MYGSFRNSHTFTLAFVELNFCNSLVVNLKRCGLQFLIAIDGASFAEFCSGYQRLPINGLAGPSTLLVTIIKRFKARIISF